MRHGVRLSTILGLCAALAVVLGAASLVLGHFQRQRATAALLEALAGEDEAAALELLTRGADPNARHPDGPTALWLAAVLGSVPVVEALLERGADPDDAGAGEAAFPPLGMAAFRGHGHVVERLLQAGADVNARGDSGRTALDFAAQADETEITLLLLRRGADPNLVADGYFGALTWAADRGNLELVRALLDAGAEVDYQDGNGVTAVAAAQRGGHVNVLRELLEHGADPTVEAWGAPPLEWARRRLEHDASSDATREVIRLLEAAERRWRGR